MFRFCISLMGLLVLQNVQAQNIDHKSIAAAEAKAASAKMQLSSNATTWNYDLKYHRFVWQIDPAIYYIQGNVTSYFVPQSPSFSSMEFDCSNSLTVDSVYYHGVSISQTQLAGDVLHISFPGTLTQHVLDSVTVYYQGAPASTGFGSFIQDTHAGIPVIWTLSEPYGAQDWWPCKQDLVDKIDSMDVWFTTPAQYRVASNGLLIGRTLSGSDSVFHWQSHYPIAAYLVAIAVTNFASYSDWVTMSNGDSLEILNYVYPENLSSAQAQLSEIIPAIRLYDSLTIDYPFKNEKYGHCQFGWGGGMEHQTMTFISGFSAGLINHECAHQWFGDDITCGSWEDIWLNEGFATYFEGLTREFLYPAQWNNWKAGTISSITSLPDGSVFCSDTTTVNRIFDGRLSYDKGSYVLHMLRWQIGDSAFFQGLRNYLNDTTLSYGYAKTQDLKAHLEASSGQNLTVFFNQWYYQQGYPSYSVYWYNTGSGVQLSVYQGQSDPSVAFFTMPIPIEFIGPGHDTIVVFNHTYSGQQFFVPLSFTVNQVNFDPDLWILSANNQIILGTQDQSPQNKSFTISPNPVKGLLNIHLLSASNTKKIIVRDMKGNLVLIRDFSNTSHTENYSVDVSMLPAATYTITFSGDFGLESRRFVLVDK